MATAEQVCTRTVTIINRQGLHARPVMQFVDIANQFGSSVMVSKGDQTVDGKSPMDMIVLEATQGTELRLEAKGTDANEAIEALADLIDRGFDEL